MLKPIGLVMSVSYMEIQTLPTEHLRVSDSIGYRLLKKQKWV